MRIFIIILFLVNFSITKSQNVTAFVDEREYFWIFDSGEFKKITEIPITSFKVGGNFVAFIDNSMTFKAYYQGEVHEIDMGGITYNNYFATRNFIAYSAGGFLSLVDKEGRNLTLSRHVSKYLVEEFLVAYTDWNTFSLVAYYNGNVTKLETNLAGDPVINFDAGENTIAYITTVEQKFKIFYRGKVIEIMDNADPTMKYEADRDIVVYADPTDNTFNAFNQGDVYELEVLHPQSFQVGDGLVAYVDQMGAFKVFSGGEVETLSTFPPKSYEVKDSIVVYTMENNQFKAYFNGDSYDLEVFIPSIYVADRSTLVYIDENRNGKLLMNGEVKTVIFDIITADLKINWNVISYRIGTNTYKVYYKGKFYQR
jgi:10-bladed beta propeller domain